MFLEQTHATFVSFGMGAGELMAKGNVPHHREGAAGTENINEPIYIFAYQFGGKKKTADNSKSITAIIVKQNDLFMPLWKYCLITQSTFIIKTPP